MFSLRDMFESFEMPVKWAEQACNFLWHRLYVTIVTKANTISVTKPLFTISIAQLKKKKR